MEQFKALSKIFIGYFLVTISLLAVLLGFVPLFYPVVLAICLFAHIAGIVVLYIHEWQYLKNGLPGGRKRKPLLPLRIYSNRYGFRDFYRERKLSQRALRAVRLSAFAAFFGLFMAALIYATSIYFFINPLNRELDPLKNKYSRPAEFRAKMKEK